MCLFGATETKMSTSQHEVGHPPWMIWKRPTTQEQRLRASEHTPSYSYSHQFFTWGARGQAEIAYQGPQKETHNPNEGVVPDGQFSSWFLRSPAKGTGKVRKRQKACEVTSGRSLEESRPKFAVLCQNHKPLKPKGNQRDLWRSLEVA